MMNWLRRNRRSPWYPRVVSLLICLTVFCVIAIIRAAGGLQFLELKTFDLLVQLQPKSGDFASKIVLVGMDDQDIRELGYPITDAVLRDLLNKLLAAGPSAVGIDIIRDHQVTDPQLLTMLADRRVVSVVKYGGDGAFFGIPPKEVKPSQIGFADFATDDYDRRVRRAMLFFTDAGSTTYQALSLRLATRYLRAVEPSTKIEPVPGAPDTWFRLGGADYQPIEPTHGAYVGIDTGGTQVMLDFRGTHHYERVSVRSVLNGTADTKPFAGKVLIVAMTARQTVKDLVSTSLVTDAYGAEVHATIAEQLIRAAQTGRRPPRAWHDLAEHGWMLGWTLAGTFVAIGIRRPVRFALVLGVSIAALLAACFVAFVVWGFWIPALPPLLGCAVAAGFVTQYLSHHERAERGVLNDLFNRIVDEDVAKTIWARRDELLDHGQLAARELRATVLFTDLEGFTTITEAMDKTCLMRFLNDYMTAMSDVVSRKADAFVNKYIGDAIMAVFGPPLERTPEQARLDARNAVECALEMRARLAEHRARWERECSDGIRKKLETGATPGAVPPWAAQVRPPEVSVRMRIGIQSGMVTAGSLGSRQRLEYTVIGDTVNTAARLESFDKELMAPDLAAGGCRILIGQDTLDLLPPGEYLTREVGSIQLKGKEQHVTIHGVIGRAESTNTPASTHAAPVEVNV